MLLKPFNLHTPKRLAAALELYGALPDVRLQAGGTFLLNNLKTLKRKGAKTPQHVISLFHIPELKGISREGGHVIIKSMTTIDEIYNSSQLTGKSSILHIAAKNISSQLIRNMATLGGNLTCRYTWTEMPATMIALEARLHFTGTNGEEIAVPAQEFFKNAAKTDKVFTHVTIAEDASVAMAYFRAKKSPYVDIPLLSLCIKTRPVQGRFSETIVAVNNCVTFAQRDYVLEGFLNENHIRPGIEEQALAYLDEAIYDTRSSDYKKHMFRVGIKHAIRDLIGKSHDYSRN